MSREQSLIIVGYGYADCLLGGAIVALKEKEEGRGTELRFSSMNGLAGVLAGVLLQEKRPGVIYLVGIGLGRNSRLLAEKNRVAGKVGSACGMVEQPGNGGTGKGLFVRIAGRKNRRLRPLLYGDGVSLVRPFGENRGSWRNTWRKSGVRKIRIMAGCWNWPKQPDLSTG